MTIQGTTQESLNIQSAEKYPTKGRQKRRSRIHRSKNPDPLRLTERRIAELDILYHHRLADSDVFRVILPGSDQQILKELRKLWDAGYIDRPLEQWIMHLKHNGGKGRKEIIYTLTNKGREVLAQRLDYQPTKTDLNRKNHELGETTIFHDLTLTRLWAGLKAALDQKREQTKQPYNLVFWYQDRPDREQLKTELQLNNGQAITIIPDAAFKLQCPQSQYLFFVENYRNRKGGHQTYLDHLKLYNIYYQQKKFEKYRTTKGFRVLTIVPTRGTASNLIKLINTEEKNKELRQFRFWFTSEEDYRLYRKEQVKENAYKKIKEVESILKPIFCTPVDEKRHSLEE